jgi:catechol 2,3-dioxygenase-like lactoylglutathione lyase family enzyme
MIAVIDLAGQRIEFIEYRDPKTKPFHGNPSITGAGHLAFKVDDIVAERARLESHGVRFHSPINTFLEKGSDREWRWCYFRGPDDLVFELVQHEED